MKNCNIRRMNLQLFQVTVHILTALKIHEIVPIACEMF